MTADPSHPSSAGVEADPLRRHGLLHGSFSHVRSLAAPPASVFAAYADLALRRRWFHIPSDPAAAQHELDFRVGGSELARGTVAPSGVPETIEYHSRFVDIVAAERIVFTYEVIVDGRRRSVSLATVELVPEAGGTRLTYTEHYVFLVVTADGRADVAERENGMRLQLNGLPAVLERSVAAG
jgi:uncharacterized protein YndB with AHSA1/START domain